MITFFDYHFPNMATHCEQSECGFSFYNGILIQWDEDHDNRVIDVINEMRLEHVLELQIVQEHEGCIGFVWKNKIPELYKVGEEISVPDGDIWHVCFSISIKDSI